MTSQVWDATTGEEVRTLEGHKNIVYAIAFNNPYGDKVKEPSTSTPIPTLTLILPLTQPLPLLLPFPLPLPHLPLPYPYP